MENYRDYIEPISRKYPACNIVKDPFANLLGKCLGLEDVSRFWEVSTTSTGKRYGLAFNSKEHPTALPFFLFSWDKYAVPDQVWFNMTDNVPSKLEYLSFCGYTMFISDSWWKDRNVFWRPNTSLEQVLIDLELTATSN